jgi:sugar phosphate isomerase/epimerase
MKSHLSLAPLPPDPQPLAPLSLVPLSLAHLTMIDASPSQLIDAARAGRFSSVGLRIAPPWMATLAFPLVGDEAAIREVEHKLADTGITVFDVEAFWIRPDTEIASLQPAVELAARLGAQHLLAMGDDPIEGRLAAKLNALAELARSFGMGVGLEFLPYVHVGNLRAALRLVKMLDRPNLGVVIDALHLMRSGGSPELLAAQDGRVIAYGQLCDARGPEPFGTDQLRREARSGRYYPGEGALPLAAIVNALPAGKPLAVEAPCEALAHLPIEARGVRCGEATRALLAKCEQGSARAPTGRPVSAAQRC